MAKYASAKRHAEAVFQLALQENKVQQWCEELEKVFATIGDSQLLAILENPKIRFSDKKQIIEKCIPDASDTIVKLVDLMVAKQRLGILGQVVEEYKRLADIQQGIEHAEVVTAVPIDKAEEKKLTDYLAVKTGKKIIISTEVDPAIIGGFIARIGDKLIDGSTRAKLEALKKQLIQAA